MTGERQEELLGGNVARVVRIGDTVRKPAGFWSASVDALLAHLEAAGVEYAPRALGYDEQGRQVLSYVEGTVSADPGDLSPPALGDLGRLLGELHRILAAFEPPTGARWFQPIEPDATVQVCHNDVAPWNLVRAKNRFVLIDWDGAGPASPSWDLAYAAQSFVPLAPGVEEEREAQRLSALVDGYGLDEAGRRALLETLAPRAQAMAALLARGRDERIEPWRSIEERDGAYWRACARHLAGRAARYGEILGIDPRP